MKTRTILVIALLFALVTVAYAGNGVGDGTGPIGDGDKTPDRLDWVCTIDGTIETCCPPNYKVNGNVCTKETIL